MTEIDFETRVQRIMVMLSAPLIAAQYIARLEMRVELLEQYVTMQVRETRKKETP